LALQHSERYFKANLELCQRRLRTAIIDSSLMEKPKELADELVRKSESILSSRETKNPLGVFNEPKRVELPLVEPLSHAVPVKSGQTLTIEAAVEYLNTAAVKNREAVFVLKCIDADGNEVEEN